MAYESFIQGAIWLPDILDESESIAGRHIIERKQTLVFDVRETGGTEDNERMFLIASERSKRKIKLQKQLTFWSRQTMPKKMDC